MRGAAQKTSFGIGLNIPGPNDGGVSYYNFNAANANDQWGSNDGTVNGATHQPSGGPRGDGAYSFDGTDDSIDLGTIPEKTAWTVSVWANANSIGTEHGVIAFGSNNGCLIQSNADQYQFYVYDGSFNSVHNEGAINDVWYHLTLAWDGTTAYAYVNGNLQGTLSISSQSSFTASDLIGEDDGTNNWDGEIDEVRIYDRALAAWEITNIYKFGAYYG